MQRDQKFADARTVMKRIGARLVRERKIALSEGGLEDDVEKSREYGKDLLSLLVKANVTDPEASSMSDEDVQDREPTHLIWTLFSFLIHVYAFFTPIQKSPLSSSPVTRRAARVSLGVFTVYQPTSRRRSVYVTRFGGSAPIRQMWSR